MCLDHAQEDVQHGTSRRAAAGSRALSERDPLCCVTDSCSKTTSGAECRLRRHRCHATPVKKRLSRNAKPPSCEPCTIGSFGSLRPSTPDGHWRQAMTT